MGILNSLFGGNASPSENVTRLANTLSVFVDALRLGFISDPLENHFSDQSKRMAVVFFLFGAADFLGRHTHGMSEEEVLFGLTKALEYAFGLSPSEAESTREEAVGWSSEANIILYMEEGATAAAEFMDNQRPPGAALRALYRSSPDISGP